jgi:hypothetical protein
MINTALEVVKERVRRQTKLTPELFPHWRVRAAENLFFCLNRCMVLDRPQEAPCSILTFAIWYHGSGKQPSTGATAPFGALSTLLWLSSVIMRVLPNSVFASKHVNIAHDQAHLILYPNHPGHLYTNQNHQYVYPQHTRAYTGVAIFGQHDGLLGRSCG